MGCAEMSRQSIEEFLDGVERRRLKADAKAEARLDRLETAAEALVGTLIREGKEVFYINLRTRDGRLTGKTLEGNRFDLVNYLIRNRYV
ncbi:hypothetical protein [Microcystis phage Mwe-JY26]